tara:strand:- start:586 stop:1089 length:504 start_codon:yes stop_codon:yes gene_type:complete
MRKHGTDEGTALQNSFMRLTAQSLVILGETLKLFELFTTYKLYNKSILNRLRKHEQEIEYDEVQAQTTKAFGNTGQADLMSISNLYSSGTEDDMALADALLDIAHKKVKRNAKSKAVSKHRQKITPANKPRDDSRGNANETGKRARPSTASSNRVNKLATQYMRKGK